MKMKSGLLGLGLLVTAGAVTVSCGGDSDGDGGGKGGSGSTGTAGTTSTGTAGTTATGTAGKTGTGTAGSTGTGTAGSTGTGGSGSNTGGSNATGGTNNNTGGVNTSGGADPGNNPDCPATAPTDGAACTLMLGRRESCDYGTTSCTCRGMAGGGDPGDGGEPAMDERNWDCMVDGGGNTGGRTGTGGFGTGGRTGTGGFGTGGFGTGGGNVGTVECPATMPADDDACTGIGNCEYGDDNCVCFNGNFNCL
ncbi:MAG TPA: hypothetical protein VIW29_05430 [Polyangiaceae bacterium]